MICTKQAFRVPSDSVEVENGCMICTKQTFRAPSDSAPTENGCMICAKQAFRIPSDSAEAGNGCNACARQISPTKFLHPFQLFSESDGEQSTAQADPQARYAELY